MPLDVSVGSSNAEAGSNIAQQNYSASSLNSIEQFITPVRIEKTHPIGAQTPGFRGPSVLGEKGLYGDEAVGPTVDELDPYFPQILTTNNPNFNPSQPPGDGNPEFLSDDGSEFMKVCDYRIVGHDGGPPEKHDTNLRKYEDNDGLREDIKIVQTMAAVRGPLIMSGWGFGMDDLPVPQKGTSYPDNLTFDPDMAADRARWKTGPVHLMWDDERQVWQGGYHIVCGVATGAISPPGNVCTPTTFTVNLFRNTQHLGGKLSDVTEETITVYNRDPSLEQEHVPNAVFVIAIKLNYEWIPLWVGCPETPACGEYDHAAGEWPDKPPCIENDTCGPIPAPPP